MYTILTIDGCVNRRVRSTARHPGRTLFLPRALHLQITDAKSQVRVRRDAVLQERGESERTGGLQIVTGRLSC